MNLIWILAAHYVLANKEMTAVAVTTSTQDHGVGFYIADGLRGAERHGSTNLRFSSNATSNWNQTKNDPATVDSAASILSTRLEELPIWPSNTETVSVTPGAMELDTSLPPTPSAFPPSLNVSWPGHLEVGSQDSSDLGGSRSKSSNTSLNASAAISSGPNDSVNRNDTAADLCWKKWQSLWSAQRPLSAYSPTLTGGQASLHGREVAPRASATGSAPSSVRLAGFSTVATTETVTIVDAGHTIATEVTTYSVRVYFEDEKPIATHSIVMPGDFHTFYTMTPIASFIRTPTCHLPASYSSCQSEWNTYLSNAAVPMPRPNLDCHPIITIEDNTPMGVATQPPCYQTYQSRYTVWSESACAASPPCSQAKASEDQCTSMKDGWVAGNNPNLARATVSGAFDMSNGFIRQGSTDTWSWPTTLRIAPGCTLGCGRCAVTGGTIQLLFWPPGSNHDATAAPSTLKTLGTILTSPTNYISFKSVSAADACSDVGPTLTSHIIAIPTDASLSTKYGVFDLDSIGPLPLPYVRASTAPLNISNLMLDPVPYSIYASQPWCASHELTQMYRGSQTSCETSRNYSPILVVPDAVLQSLAPEWASCSADLRGLYDPPIALQPVEVAASPTLPAVVTSQRPMNGLTASQVPKTYTAAAAETLAILPDDYKSSSIRTSSQAPRPNVVEQVISVITAIMLPSSHAREDKTAPGLTDSRPSAASPSNALDVLQEAQQQEPSLEAASTSHPHPLLQTITSQAHIASTPLKAIFTLLPTCMGSSEGSLGSRLGEEITVYPVQRGSANAVVINDQITVVEGAAITSNGHREYSLGGSGLVVYDHDSIVTTLASESLHEMFQPSSGVALMVQDRLVTIYAASNSAFVVNGITLSQGGTALILDELTLSNAPAGIVAESSGSFLTTLRAHTGSAANATTSDLETTTHSSSLPTSISALETTKAFSSMSMTMTRIAPGSNTEVPWSELSKASKASFSWLRVCPAILLAVCAAL